MKGPRIDDRPTAFAAVPLHTTDGEYVFRRRFPFFKHWPEALQVGARLFLWREEHGQYREADGFIHHVELPAITSEETTEEPFAFYSRDKN